MTMFLKSTSAAAQAERDEYETVTLRAGIPLYHVTAWTHVEESRSIPHLDKLPVDAAYSEDLAAPKWFSLHETSQRFYAGGRSPLGFAEDETAPRGMYARLLYRTARPIKLLNLLPLQNEMYQHHKKEPAYSNDQMINMIIRALNGQGPDSRCESLAGSTKEYRDLLRKLSIQGDHDTNPFANTDCDGWVAMDMTPAPGGYYKVPVEIYLHCPATALSPTHELLNTTCPEPTLAEYRWGKLDRRLVREYTTDRGSIRL